jgi:hypothetical protein
MMHTLFSPCVVAKHLAAVDRNVRMAIVTSQCCHCLAFGIEEPQVRAICARVDDDELVVRGARDADSDRVYKHAHAHVANERTVDAEHAHTVVAAVCDGNMTVAGHEAQPMWPDDSELTNAAAFRPEATTTRAVAAVEHRDAVRRL